LTRHPRLKKIVSGSIASCAFRTGLDRPWIRQDHGPSPHAAHLQHQSEI